MTARATKTLLLAIVWPDEGIEELDPEDIADQVVAMVNKERARNGRNQFKPVGVSAIPAAQWMTAETMTNLRAAAQSGRWWPLSACPEPIECERRGPCPYCSAAHLGRQP